MIKFSEWLMFLIIFVKCYVAGLILHKLQYRFANLLIKFAVGSRWKSGHQENTNQPTSAIKGTNKLTLADSHGQISCECFSLQKSIRFSKNGDLAKDRCDFHSSQENKSSPKPVPC